MKQNAFSKAVASPYVLLSLAILCWGGNFVVGRWANADVPPIALSFWRHLFALMLSLPFVVPALRTDWPAVRDNLGTFAVLSALFAGGNTLVYFAVLHTTVINVALINAGVPVMAAVFSWLILHDRINFWQAGGIVLCFFGIATVVTRANLATLLSQDFGWGDLFMLLAIICWALYMALLKRASVAVSPWTLLVVLTGGATLGLLPAYGIELGLGHAMEWTGRTVLSLAYVAIFSTILAWAWWNSGTLRIGPNRASAFMCLHPVFGAVLGMIFFGEVLYAYHFLGAALVLAGVFIVARPYAAAVSGGRTTESRR
jgi:drug/metabolite transporter (DMT)-like permease